MKTRNFLIAAIVALSAFQPTQADKLVIMHTNDVHGNVVPEKPSQAGGVVRRMVLVDSIRTAEKHSILVDAGDDVQGFLYFTLYGGRVEYGAMNRLGYDIAVPGNHEFDNGMDSLARNYRILKAEKLCANYDVRGTQLEGLIKEYTIKEFDGKRIAFIGVGCQPKGMISPENVKGVVYHDAMAVADSIAGLLKGEKKADYAVVVSHIGYMSDRKELPSDSLMAVGSRNIDLIIGGHSHTTIDPSAPHHPTYLLKNKVGRTVLVAQTGRWGEKLGKITIDLDDLQKTPEYELLPVDSRYDNHWNGDSSAQRLAGWLEPFTKGVEKLESIVIGKSEGAYANGQMNPLSNWVADVAYEIGQRMVDRPVDFAVVNKGGIRQPMPKGDVSMGLMLSMLPFANSVVVMELDGWAIQDGFDVMASRGGDAISRQASAEMKNGQAVNIKINGKPLDLSKKYVVATIDYLAEGGDNMESFTTGKRLARSENVLKYDVIDYIKNLTSKGLSISPDTTQRMQKAD